MDSSFNNLRESKRLSPEIKNMKKERDTLTRELQTDKANLSKIEARIKAKSDQSEKISQMVTFLEEKMEAYETLINESEEAYTKVMLHDLDYRECRKIGHCSPRTM